MCSNGSLKPMLEKLNAQLHALFGSHLKATILYGSYARGDEDEESDVDVLILVDVEAVLPGHMVGKERADHLAAVHADNGVDALDIGVALGNGDGSLPGHGVLVLHAGDVDVMAVVAVPGGEVALIGGDLQFGVQTGFDLQRVHNLTSFCFWVYTILTRVV